MNWTNICICKADGSLWVPSYNIRNGRLTKGWYFIRVRKKGWFWIADRGESWEFNEPGLFTVLCKGLVFLTGRRPGNASENARQRRTQDNG